MCQTPVSIYPTIHCTAEIATFMEELSVFMLLHSFVSPLSSPKVYKLGAPPAMSVFRSSQRPVLLYPVCIDLHHLVLLFGISSAVNLTKSCNPLNIFYLVTSTQMSVSRQSVRSCPACQFAGRASCSWNWWPCTGVVQWLLVTTNTASYH